MLNLISFGEVKGNKITSFKILRDREEGLKEEIKKISSSNNVSFFHSTFHLCNGERKINTFLSSY
jgi:hypothetical protein